RTFVLILKPRTEIFAPQFKLVVVHADGSENIVSFKEGDFYSGTVEGEENSEVHGYFDDDNFVGTIDVDGQLYVIEAAWRHLHGNTQSEGSDQMLMYRGQDIKWPGGQKNGLYFIFRNKYCKSAHVEDDTEIQKDKRQPTERILSRKKRATPSKNTCDVYAVADYKFFKTIGRSDIYKTAKYIVDVIKNTDTLYRKINWEGSNDFTGLGVEIGLIKIHDSYTDTVSLHYNKDKSDWETTNLLKVFGRDLTMTSYCLGHLFTHESFTDNVLGLAYIASSRIGSAGGICSPTRVSAGFETAFNTAFTSTSNANGDTVLKEQSDLVTAHEIGHNWGSEHDPDTSECAPSSFSGDGKYLMYPFSVAGYDSNNDKFSPCSKRWVSEVLAAKADFCFKEPTPVTDCGNGKLDAGEECDAGFLGKYGQDECCNTRCQLKQGAICSPYNHECCASTCDMAQVGTICRNDTYTSCKKIGYCTGNSLECPTEEDADDDTDCRDDGICRGGRCLGLCERNRLTPCLCEEVDTSCNRCCRGNATGNVCVRADPLTALPDGRPCVQGYCASGSCKKAAQSLVERLFDFIESITFDKILIFFKDNIVGVILVFSLIIWIPVSCFVSYYVSV
ncbi:hypothetical protein LOTGIDRAFT_140416, partial [Lottia gigantea]